MLTRRFFLGGLIAAPAVVRADSLMKLHHIPERWATVWGVGWDLEIVEVPLWEPISVAQFGGSVCLGGHIDKFREVTDWVYHKPTVSITPPSHYSRWHDRQNYVNDLFDGNYCIDKVTYDHPLSEKVGEDKKTTFLHKLNITT